MRESDSEKSANTLRESDSERKRRKRKLNKMTEVGKSERQRDTC